MTMQFLSVIDIIGALIGNKYHISKRFFHLYYSKEYKLNMILDWLHLQLSVSVQASYSA